MENEGLRNEHVRNEVLQGVDISVPVDIGFMDPSSNSMTCNFGFGKLIGDKKINQKDRRRVKRELDPEYRERERLKNLERARKLRADPSFRDKERLRNRICKRKARLDPNYREAEKVRNRMQKRKAREDPIYREAERKRNMWQKRRAREDPTYRIREKIKGLERKCKGPWGLTPSEEWMEMGPVPMDPESKVAFEHGLYRLMPGDRPLSESFRLRPEDSKLFLPDEAFSGWSEMEKEMFAKLYFNSREPQPSKLEGYTPSVDANQIDHNHYLKLGDQNLPENVNRQKEDQLNHNHINTDISSGSNVLVSGADYPVYGNQRFSHFLDLSEDNGNYSSHHNTRDRNYFKNQRSKMCAKQKNQEYECDVIIKNDLKPEGDKINNEEVRNSFTCVDKPNLPSQSINQVRLRNHYSNIKEENSDSNSNNFESLPSSDQRDKLDNITGEFTPTLNGTQNESLKDLDACPLDKNVKVPSYDIEILPLRNRTEMNCPNLDWQIEVLKIRKNQTKTDEHSLCLPITDLNSRKCRETFPVPVFD